MWKVQLYVYNTGDHDTMDMLVKELKTNRTIIELDKSAASKPRVLESCLHTILTYNYIVHGYLLTL